MIAGRTFLSLQEEVLAFQFAPGKYRSQVKTWLNDACRIIVRQSEIRTAEEAASYSTSSGTATLELPTDFARIIDFHDTEEDRPLEQISLREYDSLPSATGRPSLYAASGNNLLAYPTPDGAYELSLRYWRLPQDMVADDDEPELPVIYHQSPIPYAMWKAYAHENDRTERELWKGDWETGLLKLRGEVQSDAADTPTQVPGTWGEIGGEAPVVRG